MPNANPAVTEPLTENRADASAGLQGGRLSYRGAAMNLSVCAAYALVIVTLLWATGSFRSEVAGGTDEAAHYVNGLLVREYLAHGVPHSPMRFAIQYYLHYPKVTFGHWPPGFYLTEALWMAMFSSSRVSVLLMMGAGALLLAFVLWRAASEQFGPVVAFVTALVFLLLRLSQEQFTMTMTDIFLALFCLLAALSWAHYLARGRPRDAIWFGLWASFAIMTKGDAWALAPAAALSALLTGRLWRMKERAFWIPAVIVSVTCVPLYWFMRAWSFIGFYGGRPSLAYTRDAIGKIALIFPAELGWPLTIALLLGLAGYLLIPSYRTDVALGTFFCLIVAAVAMESIAPTGVVEARKIYWVLPPCMIFAALGIKIAAGAMPAVLGRWRLLALGAVVVAAFLIFDFSLVKRYDRGYRDLAALICSRFQGQAIGVVVSSGGPFEEVMVAEMAHAAPYPSHYVIRAAEVLNDEEWTGPMHLLYHTPEEVDAALQRIHARVLVVHHMDRPSEPARDLTNLVEGLAALKSAQWTLIFDRRTHTDRGDERLQAWDLQTGPGEPNLDSVIKRLWEKRLIPAGVGR